MDITCSKHRWVLEDSGEEVCSICATVNDAPTIHHEYTELEVIGTGVNTARHQTLLKGRRNWNLPGQDKERAAQKAAVCDLILCALFVGTSDLIWGYIDGKKNIHWRPMCRY
jgi:hypothetical protein